MMRPSGTDPVRDQSFSTTPTISLGMRRRPSQATNRTRATRPPKTARAVRAVGPRAGAVPPAANTTGNMVDPEVGDGARRREMNDGVPVQVGPPTQRTRPARLADGLGL